MNDVFIQLPIIISNEKEDAEVKTFIKNYSGEILFNSLINLRLPKCNKK